jgi:LysM repeat protein
VPEPTCHYCDREADEECPTCGRLYCPEHGEDVCLRCMAPESAAPSALAYRGSIAALVLATLVTVFLLVRPPESKSDNDNVRLAATSTPAVAATATPTRQGGNTPATTRTGVASTTTPASSTVAGSPSPTASAATYTVQPGDTLSGIAAKNNTTIKDLINANPGLSETAPLQIGQVLKLPQ